MQLYMCVFYYSLMIHGVCVKKQSSNMPSQHFFYSQKSTSQKDYLEKDSKYKQVQKKEVLICYYAIYRNKCVSLNSKVRTK